VSWKVTVRHGPKVNRERFESLDEAIAEARARIETVRREGGLPQISAFRDYAPGQRVHAWIEISGPGLLRGKEGGIDVMGDGALVAYTGAIRKRELGGDGLEEGLQRLQQALSS
jgi:hypothetical protein